MELVKINLLFINIVAMESNNDITHAFLLQKSSPSRIILEIIILIHSTSQILRVFQDKS